MAHLAGKEGGKWAMTKAQLAKFEKHAEPGSLAHRLLEERKRLLAALIALASGDASPKWQEAILFAEEQA